MKVINPTEIDLLTQGERYTLEQKLKKIFSGEDCYIYIQPTINSLRPDFIVIGKSFGVLIIEVKDWDDTFIISSNKSVVTCRTNKFKNPVCQIDTYSNMIHSKLNGVLDFIGDDGQLKIPVKSSIFYVNLSDDALSENQDLQSNSVVAFSKRQLRTLTREELVGDEVLEITDKSMLAIRGVLFPEIAIPQEEHLNKDEFISVKDVRALDYEQEEFAKKVPNGHYMVSGIPGSGKTVILLSRALHLAQSNESYKIAILTYTKALANKLKHQLSIKSRDMQLPKNVEDRIEIKHFHKLCYDLVGFNKKLADENPDSFYNELWPKEAIEAVKNRSAYYDAILVDEYQDFHVDWFELCKSICIKNDDGQENLFFAGDRLQRIYDITWNSYKEIGINIVGRSKLLKTPYRTNQNHLDFALKFLSLNESLSKDIGNFYEIDKLNNFSMSDGSIDIVEGGVSSVSHYIEQLVNKIDVNVEDILVLCHTNNECKEMLGILPNKIKNNFVSGKEPEKGKGLITTYHSSKGLEAKYCLLYKVEKFESDKNTRTLVYVGMTRASERLIVNYEYNRNFASEITNLLVWQNNGA